jgi:phage terminase small subunit
MYARVPAQLTPRQEAFCRKYLSHFSLTRAAIEAGYSRAAAHAQANYLMNLPKIKERIAVLSRPMHREELATAERVLQELSRIAFADPREMYDEHGHLKPVHLLEAHVAANIAEVTEETRFEGRGEDAVQVRTKKVKAWDKLRALEALSKHLKLYTDAASTVVTVNSQTNVQLNTADLRNLTDDERSLVRQLAESHARRSSEDAAIAGPDQG